MSKWPMRFATLLVICHLFVIGMMWRTLEVHEFRLEMIERISATNQREIKAGIEDWRWRYGRFNTVSFDLMMWKFWTPLKPEWWWSDVSWLQARTK